jgi:hypothetical protein
MTDGAVNFVFRLELIATKNSINTYIQFCNSHINLQYINIRTLKPQLPSIRMKQSICSNRGRGGENLSDT